MANYIKEEYLQEIIKGYQADGSRAEELVVAAQKIARNLWQRDHYKYHGSEEELQDYCQDIALAVLDKIRHFDLSRGRAFSFLTRLICNKMSDCSRKEVRVVRKQIQSLEQMQSDPYVLRRMSRYAA